MIRDVVRPVPEGCVIAVAQGGYATGSDEHDAMRNLVLACGSQPLVELYRSSTLRKGSVWVEDHCILWHDKPGIDPPTLYARLVDGKRLAVGEPEPVPEPRGWAAKMVAKRKAQT